jgi:ankyrin repeat protein
MSKSSLRRKRTSLSSIHRLVLDGDLGRIREATERGDDIDSLDSDGRTPLFISVKDGDVAVASALIDAGANVNARDINLETPLHFAAREYRVVLAKLLLDHGAAVDAQDSHGNTSLFRAVFDSKGRGDMILLLLAHSADKYLQNKHGVSPEELANSIANFDVGKFLK